MSERRIIATISVITDSENSYDNIGDIVGGFTTDFLWKHIQHYGTNQLLQKLTHMIHQVWEIKKDMQEVENKINNTLNPPATNE